MIKTWNGIIKNVLLMSNYIMKEVTKWLLVIENYGNY